MVGTSALDRRDFIQRERIDLHVLERKSINPSQSRIPSQNNPAPAKMKVGGPR